MEDTGESVLRDIIVGGDDYTDASTGATVTATPFALPEETDKDKNSTENHAQWALGGNGKYTPVGHTIDRLPAGIYEPFASPSSWGVEKLNMVSDGIYELPDMPTQIVLNEVKKFWASEEKYRQHKLLYKRGILLWGPPGGGKTVAVKLLINDLIKNDGIVMLVTRVELAVIVLKAIRRIEPKRNLIVVFEDIDEIINFNGESHVLSMLDGENNIDNILHIATTNYPERLGPRIINRPSRFDRLVLVGMPNDASRAAYLRQATNGGLPESDLEQWTNDTKGLSVAHLRELVASVYCLGQDYEDAIKRLKIMGEPVKTDDGMKRRRAGFNDRLAEVEFVASTSVGG